MNHMMTMTHTIVSNVGNLKSYKMETLPTARKLFGEYPIPSMTKHKENIRNLLEILAVNGLMSTWDMARTSKMDDISYLRSREKEYRRLLVGRIDRGKKSPGVLDLGLVVKFLPQDHTGAKYRLSIHGLLYAMTVLALSSKDYESIAKNYSDVLPYVFGRWDLLKSHLTNPEIFLIGIGLGLGYSSDDVHVPQNKILPIASILQYLETKYGVFYDMINETDLAEQLSYQYYTYVLTDKKNPNSIETLKEIFTKDKKLQTWYNSFLNEVILFYENKFSNLRSSIL